MENISINQIVEVFETLNPGEQKQLLKKLAGFEKAGARYAQSADPRTIYSCGIERDVQRRTIRRSKEEF